MSDAYHNSLNVPRLTPPEKVRVLVGTLGSTIYNLPRDTLYFYSPWLRKFITSPPLSRKSAIIIPRFEPPEFDVLVAWTKYETSSQGNYHQRGAELREYIAKQDAEGVHLAWKVWALANCMGGACVTLRDECMKFLHHEYMTAAPGEQSLPITPGVAMYAISRNDVDDLGLFVLTLLAWDGMLRENVVGPINTWHLVLQELPELARFMANGCQQGRKKMGTAK
jgi:hypothetical protein